MSLHSNLSYSEQVPNQTKTRNVLVKSSSASLTVLASTLMPPFLQAFLQDLGRSQATVAAFGELSNHLLREYSCDDTRRIKEVADKHGAAWNSICNRCRHSPVHLSLYTSSSINPQLTYILSLYIRFFMCGRVFDSSILTVRSNDRHTQLDTELKGLQMSLRELESFLKWLQEAETTANVLADASQREDLSQDSAHTKELRRQLEVGL